MEGICVFKQEINHARIFKTHIRFIISGRMREGMKGEDTEGKRRRRRG